MIEEMKVCRYPGDATDISFHVKGECSSKLICQTGYSCKSRFGAEEEVSVNASVDGIDG